MPDGEGAPGTPVVSPPAAPGSAPITPPVATAAFVTKDEFKALTDRLQAQSDLIGGFRNELKAFGTRETKKPDETLTLDRQADELKKLRASIHQEKRQTALEAAVSGKLGERTEHYRKYVMAIHGERIKVSDDMQVFIEDQGQQVPISKWVEAHLQTDEGKLFMPVPGSPASTGLQSTNRQQAAASKWHGMTKDQILNEATKDRDGFAQYVMAHEADWHKKLKGQ